MVKRFRQDGSRLPVYKAIKRIREALGWTIARMASEVGVHRTTWSKFESARYEVSLGTLERFRDVTGIDAYVLAYALHYDASHLSEEVQKAHRTLNAAWESQIELTYRLRHGLPAGWPIPGAR